LGRYIADHEARVSTHHANTKSLKGGSYMQNNLKNSKVRSKASCIALIFIISSVCIAQTEVPDKAVGPGAPAAASDIGEISVTATRVNRADYSGPTPTAVVDAAQLEQLATTNIATYLNTLPVFKPDTTSAVNTPAAREAGANFLDLRGLGASRTLVLVDGLRFVPQADAGIPDYHVDLNQVPSLMVDHIEVVTGGASAQWGSDAVAGVVNILLKKKFTGLDVEAQTGYSIYGDDHSQRYGIVAGHNFADNRLNITVAADFEKNNGVGDVNTRPWGREHWWLITNPCPGHSVASSTCPAGGNGKAQQLLLPDAQFSAAAPGGLILDTALRGTTFGAGGVPQAFNYGQYVGDTFMQGGGQPGINYTKYQPIETPFKREVAYGRTTYAISDAMDVYGELSYARSESGGLGIPLSPAVTIQSDNAYLPAATRAQMLALGIPSFTLGTYTDSLFFRSNLVNQTVRGVLGLEGHFGADGNWKWSADAGDGENKYMLSVPDNIIKKNFRLASDAILNPATGQVTCRALVPGSSTYDPVGAAGCIPMDLFGPGGAGAAGAYAAGDTHTEIDYTQTFADATISGEPFKTWAGPVSIAGGGDYRNESMDAISDPIASANGYVGTNSATFTGNFHVKEAFAETVIPLLKDSMAGESLELNGAVRYEEYSGVSKGQLPWKFGVTYRPVEGVQLRAARSLDIRAPNIFERNDPASSRLSPISYGAVQANVYGIASGNPNLDPEKANTTTYGVVFTPTFAPGFAASLDHWQIKTDNLITTLAAQDVANFCLAGQQSFCKLITFSAGVPTSVSLPFLNLAVVDVKGFDAQTSYRLPLTRINSNLVGELTFSFSGTYTSHADVNAGTLGAPTIDRAGENGPLNQFAVARFVSTSSIAYSNDTFTALIQARQVSAGNYDNTFNADTISNNRIPGAVYVDLSGSYNLTQKLSIFFLINNLLNHNPPPDPTDNNSPTNATYYDVFGTVIKFGVRYKM
jgi:iron complex outermembrane receptor protein